MTILTAIVRTAMILILFAIAGVIVAELWTVYRKRWDR